MKKFMCKEINKTLSRLNVRLQYNRKMKPEIINRQYCIIRNSEGECLCTEPYKRCEDSPCPYTERELYIMLRQKEIERKNSWRRK